MAPVVETWGVTLATPAGITASRGQLHRRLSELSVASGNDEAIEALLLTYEEPAPNALRHGRLPARVTVTTMPDGWLVDVQDSAIETGPTPAVDRDPALGGLGLYLVARMCAAHGWWLENHEKHVWAYVATTS